MIHKISKLLARLKRKLGQILKGAIPPVISPSSHSFLDNSFRYKVLFVHDANTLDVVEKGEKILVRLDSIDCPEEGQTGSKKAKAVLFNLVISRSVRMETHGVDAQGRTLATIFVERNSKIINVNEKMVTGGHAKVNRKEYGHLNKRRQYRLNRLERWAESRHLGLWSYRKIKSA